METMYLENLMTKCRESEDQNVIMAAVGDLLKGKKMCTEGKSKLQFGKCCVECLVMLDSTLRKNHNVKLGSVWHMYNILDTLQFLTNIQELAENILTHIGVLLINIPVACSDSTYLKAIKTGNIIQQRFAKYLFILIARCSLSLLFSALSCTTPALRRSFEKSLLKENIINLRKIVTVLKNQLDFDIKLSCSELLWRALRRTKEEATVLAEQLGFLNCGDVEQLRGISADDFEKKAISFIESSSFGVYEEGFVLKKSLLHIKVDSENLIENELGQFEIDKAVFGDSSIMIFLKNKGRIEVPHYLVKFFERGIKEFNIICDISSDLKPNLFECWSEEARRFIDTHKTKDADKLILCIATEDINDNYLRVLNELKFCTTESKFSRIEDFDVLKKIESSKNNETTVNLLDSNTSETLVKVNDFNQIESEVYSINFQKTSDRNAKCMIKKDRNVDIIKCNKTKQDKYRKTGKLQKENVSNKILELKQKDNGRKSTKQKLSKKDCSIDLEVEGVKNFPNSYLPIMESCYLEDNSKKKHKDLEGTFHSSDESSVCSSSFNDVNLSSVLNQSDEEMFNKKLTRNCHKDNTSDKLTFSELSFDINSDILDEHISAKESNEFCDVSKICDENLQQIITKILSNRNKEDSENLKQIKELYQEAEKRIEKLSYDLAAKQEKRLKKFNSNIETKLNNILFEFNNDTTKIIEDLNDQLNNLADTESKIQSFNDIPSKLSNLRNFMPRHKELKLSLQQQLKQLKEEVLESEKSKKSNDPAMMIELLMQKMF